MWRTRTSDFGLEAEDAALVRRMRAGDEAAFAEFFDDNFQSLYRFALSRLGRDSVLAKEIAQATFAKAFEKLGTYRGEAPLFSWLCAICRFEISGHFRRVERQPRLVSAVDEEGALRDAVQSAPAVSDDPERELLRAEVASMVHLAVDQLPPRYATVLESKYTLGLSVREIAEQLGTTAKAVESLLSRAREAFRDGFQGLSRQPIADLHAVGSAVGRKP